MRRVVRFLTGDGVVRELAGVDPTQTALNLLRYDLGHTGTKEGCAEGDCGACTVALGELEGETVKWRAVNACILFAPMLDGKVVMTVDQLKDHPVQRAMVEHHGSQCGFCTPGFVMSLWNRHEQPDGTPVDDVIAGNLCRCTGYGPILTAAKASEAAPKTVADWAPALKAIAGEGLALAETESHSGVTRRWFTPASMNDLTALCEAWPDATIVAGATDVGLWVTKQHRTLETIIYLGEVTELKAVTQTPGGLRIGAGVRYSDAWAALARLHPDLGELVRRLGSVQVRNSGTIGGNIANGSPIGDMPPALIALGATLVLRKGGETRQMPLEDYFLAYGKQDRRPGEFVEAVIVPPPTGLYRVFKLSKRFDQDISAVCGGFSLTIKDGAVENARVAFGGMAATPKRAAACEAALTGKPWTEATVESAVSALERDFQPINDMRASAAYRMAGARNLLRKVFAESGGAATRVLEAGPVDA